MTAKSKQILLGAATACAILIAVEMLLRSSVFPSPDYQIFDCFYVWPAFEATIVMSLAGFGGAYVAKVNFVAPSVSLATATWTFVAFIADRIATAVDEGDLLTIMGQHSLALVAGVAGAAIGALLGRRFSARNEEHVSNAA